MDVTYDNSLGIWEMNGHSVHVNDQVDGNKKGNFGVYLKLSAVDRMRLEDIKSSNELIHLILTNGVECFGIISKVRSSRARPLLTRVNVEISERIV